MIFRLCRRDLILPQKKYLFRMYFEYLEKRHARPNKTHPLPAPFLRHQTLSLSRKQHRALHPIIFPLPLAADTILNQAARRRQCSEKWAKSIAGNIPMPRYLPSFLILASVCVLPCPLCLCACTLVLCVLFYDGAHIYLEKTAIVNGGYSKEDGVNESWQ